MTNDNVALGVATKSGGYILSAGPDRDKWVVEKHFLPEEDMNKIAMDSSGKLFAATLTEGVFTSDNFGTEWKQSSRGLHVRKVWSVAPDPHEPGTVYAGTQYGHLFRSRDSGKYWEEVTGLHRAPGRENWGIDWGFGTTGLTVHTILPDKNRKGRLYIIASGNGPYRSDDSGETWQVLKGGIDNTCPIASRENHYPGESNDPEERSRSHLSQVHACSHKLVLSEKSEGTVYQQNHCGVYVSGDHGNSWKDISPGNNQRHGFPIDVVEGRKNYVFVVPARQDKCKTHNSCIQGQLSVYRTDDGGASWKDVHNGLPDSVHTGVLRDAMSHDTNREPGVYFGTSTGEVYASTNLGESWKKIASGLGRIQGITAFSPAL